MPLGGVQLTVIAWSVTPDAVSVATWVGLTAMTPPEIWLVSGLHFGYRPNGSSLGDVVEALEDPPHMASTRITNRIRLLEAESLGVELLANATAAVQNHELEVVVF